VAVGTAEVAVIVAGEIVEVAATETAAPVANPNTPQPLHPEAAVFCCCPKRSITAHTSFTWYFAEKMARCVKNQRKPSAAYHPVFSAS
jgi:hypothetical protein